MVIRELNEDYHRLLELEQRQLISVEDKLSMGFMELITIDSVDIFKEYLDLINNEDFLLKLYVDYISYISSSVEIAKATEGSKTFNPTLDIVLFNIYKNMCLTGLNGHRYSNVLDLASKLTCKFNNLIRVNRLNIRELSYATIDQLFRVGASTVELKDFTGAPISIKQYCLDSKTGTEETNETKYLGGQFNLYSEYESKVAKRYEELNPGHLTYYYLHNIVLILLVSYSETIVNIINKSPLFMHVNDSLDLENNLQQK